MLSIKNRSIFRPSSVLQTVDIQGITRVLMVGILFGFDRIKRRASGRVAAYGSIQKWQRVISNKNRSIFRPSSVLQTVDIQRIVRVLMVGILFGFDRIKRRASGRMAAYGFFRNAHRKKSIKMSMTNKPLIECF